MVTNSKAITDNLLASSYPALLKQRMARLFFIFSQLLITADKYAWQYHLLHTLSKIPPLLHASIICVTCRPRNPVHFFFLDHPVLLCRYGVLRTADISGIVAWILPCAVCFTATHMNVPFGTGKLLVLSMTLMLVHSISSSTSCSRVCRKEVLPGTQPARRMFLMTNGTSAVSGGNREAADVIKNGSHRGGIVWLISLVTRGSAFVHAGGDAQI